MSKERLQLTRVRQHTPGIYTLYFNCRTRSGIIEALGDDPRITYYDDYDNFTSVYIWTTKDEAAVIEYTLRYGGE